MVDVILIIIVLLTPVILSLLYFAEIDNKGNVPVLSLIKYLRKCVGFVLKFLSVLFVGDTKFVTDIEKDVKKDIGADNVK